MSDVFSLIIHKLILCVWFTESILSHCCLHELLHINLIIFNFLQRPFCKLSTTTEEVIEVPEEIAWVGGGVVQLTLLFWGLDDSAPSNTERMSFLNKVTKSYQPASMWLWSSVSNFPFLNLINKIR